MGLLRYIWFGVLAVLFFAFCYERRNNVVASTADLRLTHYEAKKFQSKLICVKKESKKTVYKKHKRTRIWTQQFPFLIPDIFKLDVNPVFAKQKAQPVYKFLYYHSSDIPFSLRGPPAFV